MCAVLLVVWLGVGDSEKRREDRGWWEVSGYQEWDCFCFTPPTAGPHAKMAFYFLSMLLLLKLPSVLTLSLKSYFC